jgi:trehalose synthase
MHNGLQGMSIPLTDDMKKTYLEFNESNAKELDLHRDYVFVHDTQPAAIISQYKVRVGKWVWRCHIDLSSPNLDFINFLTPVLFQYDSLIFTLEEYVPEPLRSKKIAVIPPSIDPLSPKNKPLSDDEVLDVLVRFDVDPEKPILTQVSRFDPWKDPLGVIDVYRIVKKRVPDVQLLLIGSMARDDPEGWVFYEKTARYAGDDYGIHLLTDWKGVGDVEVNAFQRASDVVLQKSIREGFGLSVSEALWKEIPVVGGNVGGIPLQIIDGQTGFLVDNVQGAADKAIFLLKHVDAAKRMGKTGKQHVMDNFLITRLLLDELRLLKSL